jgi:endonuclease-3 related protein
MKARLSSFYRKLYAQFGRQHWWPGESPFEVVVGAILTQNTSWNNVEKAINNLKQENLLNPRALYRTPAKRLALLIKPSGYYNLKAKRLKSFLTVLFNDYQGKIKNLFNLSTLRLRQVLLSINGIGPETADSILLYAAARPVFVVDAYTRRILLRQHLIKRDASYNQIQGLFIKNLKRDRGLFNEYHALLVRLGKEICTKNNPKCKLCPLSCKQKRLK